MFYTSCLLYPDRIFMLQVRAPTSQHVQVASVPEGLGYQYTSRTGKWKTRLPKLPLSNVVKHAFTW